MVTWKERRNKLRFYGLIDLAIALTSPGIVNCVAWMSAGIPNSRRVEEVTGPIEADFIPSRRLARENLGAPNNATKFRTVEELVKVITFGRRRGLVNAARSLARDEGGTTVS